MLTSLRILNFQSHHDTTLEFHPGVNVIVGSTDSGKTAIIRALRWLKDNRPSGEAFRSTWGGDTKVELFAEHQHWFRLKGDNNHYHYNGSTFAAFGTGVPEEVEKSLNIDETNIQYQLDAPFLISSSPGEVAAYFNGIAHLEDIDKALKNLQRDVRRLQTEITSDEDRLRSLDESMESYRYLEKFDIDLEALEADQSQLNSMRSGLTALDGVVAEVVEIDEALEEDGDEALEEGVDALLALHDKAEALTADYNAVMAHTSTIHVLDTDITALDQKTGLADAVQEILDRYDELDELDQEVEAIAGTLSAIVGVDADLDKEVTAIQEMETEFHELMPDKCPLCGQETT